MTFKVTVLGNGSARPTIQRHHSAHALNVHEQFYLVDCGEGTQSRLIECGIHPLRLNAVFLSHLHGDHVYGLFPLISSMGLMGRRTPLTVFAPAPLGEVLEYHYRYFDTNLLRDNLPRGGYRKHLPIFENSVMEVWSIPLRHRVPAAGYLFREKRPELNVHKEAIERYGLGIAQITAAKRGEDISGPDGYTIPNGELTYLLCTAQLRILQRYDGFGQSGGHRPWCKPALPRGHLCRRGTGARPGDRALHCPAGRKNRRESPGRPVADRHFSSRYKDAAPLVEEARTLFPATEEAKEMHTYEIPAVKHQ